MWPGLGILAKTWSREIGGWNNIDAVKFGWHIGSCAVAVPVKFRGEQTNLNAYLVASIFHEIWW